MFGGDILRAQCGYSLIEVLVVAGLLGILTLAAATLLQQLQSTSLKSKIDITRASLISNLRHDAGDMMFLRNSLKQPENAAFLNCVCGSALGCETGVTSPFSLYQAGEVTPVSNLKHYTAAGSPCAADAPGCIFEVETKFVASCKPVPLPSDNPIAPDNCTAPAEFVGILFSVRQNPAFKGSTYPLAPVNGSAFTQVSQIAPAGLGVCP